MSDLVANQVRTVYKYPLPLTSTPGEVCALKLPAGAKILKVADQGTDPLFGPDFFVWALVDPNERFQELRYVVTIGTGHQLELTTLSERDWDYTDSVMSMDGHLVVHVWISRPAGKTTVEVSADNV